MVPFQSFWCNFMNQHKVTIQNKVFLHKLILSHFETRDSCFDLPSLDFSFSSPSLVIAWGKTSPHPGFQSVTRIIIKFLVRDPNIHTSSQLPLLPALGALRGFRPFGLPCTNPIPMPWREKELHLPAVGKTTASWRRSTGVSSGFAFLYVPI